MTTSTITAGAWQGNLGQGLAPRELEATLWAAADLTCKEIARLMGVAPGTVSKRLDDARFKLGVRTVRGLVMEAFKRQIIAPVAIGLIAIVAAHTVLGDDQGIRNRRVGERRMEQRLTGRRMDDIRLAA
ncbi:LuxR C-terminal-related transcriptional regulator [Pseudomonas fluorescens]|uniref:HTH luxR-type domain-containing protein n=1 Tax=Pseudomonas fluorescens TaxID=294 RepID=A0A5E7E832_PSEFL|nr:LuxR C-terminal-related transcriptional regulator [Pseudomonas fluorescens]VVO22824.1 hypothetical protein PS723_04354 [Pseudomonas fluorescens]